MLVIEDNLTLLAPLGMYIYMYTRIMLSVWNERDRSTYTLLSAAATQFKSVICSLLRFDENYMCV